MIEPRYKHDCDLCTFKGHLQEYDLYEPCEGSHYSFILRSSSDGPDYITTDRLDLYTVTLEQQEQREASLAVVEEVYAGAFPYHDILNPDDIPF